jgi:hypothetical protein
MNLKTIKYILMIFLFLIAACIAVVYFGGNIKGAYMRKFHTPLILKQKQFISLDDPNFSFEGRRKLVSVYHEGKGFYGVTQKRHTIEGDIITLYLATDDGQLILILDYTHDPRSIRSFLKEHPQKISFVIEEPNDYVEWQPDTKENGKLRIKCLRQSGEIIYI